MEWTACSSNWGGDGWQKPDQKLADQKRGTHTRFVITRGAQGVGYNASGIRRANWIVGEDPCGLEVKQLEGNGNISKDQTDAPREGPRLFPLPFDDLLRPLWEAHRIVVGSSHIEEFLAALVRLLGKGLLPTCPWATMLTTCTCSKTEKRGTRGSVTKEVQFPRRVIRRIVTRDA